jgi:FixJ family two-component response regulator
MASEHIVAVVDDDSAVRSAVAFLLRSFGYRAVTFESAEAFLRADILHQTSCVITDVKMPGMTGDELQQCLIAEGHRLPIIFMTAFPEEGLRLRVLSAGAHGFLSKPCQPQLLMNCIETALHT